MEKITILTQTVGFQYSLLRFAKKIIKFLLRKLIKSIKISSSEYGGHYAVTRSLIEGLKKIGTNFNYNPRRIKEIGDVVAVLSDVRTLKQAIKLKQKGVIKKLLAGPNLVISPVDNLIVSSREIDVYLVPSPWVRDVYEYDEPRLRGRLAIWPAGIDENYWLPRTPERNNVLIYWKNGLADFYTQVENIVRKCNYNPIKVVFGEYGLGDFKEILENSLFAVFLSQSESQGIALLETWAMNVPTLCWNPGNSVEQNKQFKIVSSCPYLDDQAGLEWKNIDELEMLVSKIKEYNFSPRAYAVNNFTDQKSAEIFSKLCL